MAWWLLLGIGVLADLQLPVVDLEKSNWKERAIEVLQKDASFLLVNHGLGNSSSGFWGKALSASQQLFALPETSKAQVAAGPPSAEAPVVRGYFGIGAESGTRSSRFECKEGMSLAAGERSERLAPNRLPKDLAEDHVSALEAMPAQMRLLALRLADGLAEAAQQRQILLPEDAAFLAGGGDGLEAFRIFHYLPTVDRCGGRAPSTAELLWSSDHTDWGSLTIIAQDSSDGGIEIFRDGEYHRVRSEEGALIVNGGDYLELVSHGVLPSPLHRVRESSPSSGRSSLVYFHYPAGSSPLRPMDVKKAQERRSVTPKPKGLVFNTLTNGLEELDEAITYKSHLQRKWMGVRASPAKTEL